MRPTTTRWWSTTTTVDGPRVRRPRRDRPRRRASASNGARATDDDDDENARSSSVDEAKRAVVRAIAESRRTDGAMLTTTTTTSARTVMASIERLETFPSSASAGGRWTLAYSAKASTSSSSSPMASLGVSDDVIQDITRTMYGVFFTFAPWLAGSAETNRRGARNAQTVDLVAGVVRNEVELDLKGPTTTTTSRSGRSSQNNRVTVCIGVDGEINAEDALARDAEVTFTSFDVCARFGDVSPPTVKLPLPRPRGRLTTTFCDETMRVSRGGQGGVFVLTRLRDGDGASAASERASPSGASSSG